MKKRPDAESFLSFYFKITLIIGCFILIVNMIMINIGEDANVIVIGSGIGCIVSAISISIISRFHNVLLDIRDAEYEILSLMKKNDLSREETFTDESSSQEAQVKTETSAEQLTLQAWKDAQIAKASAAYKANKISAEKYTSYVNKVNACTAIPENKQKNS